MREDVDDKAKKALFTFHAIRGSVSCEARLPRTEAAVIDCSGTAVGKLFGSRQIISKWANMAPYQRYHSYSPFFLFFPFDLSVIRESKIMVFR